MDLQTFNYPQLFLFFILGAGLAVPALLLNIRVAPKLGLIDWPKARGVALERVPIVGHSLVILSILSILILTKAAQPWFLITSFVMALMGFLDDRQPIASLDKLFFQLVCVCVIVLLNPHLQSVMTAKYGAWGTFWAIFFILGLTNAINFIDGIDGLAGLILMLGGFGYILLAAISAHNGPFVVFAALMMGMLCPFLYFNVVRRRGFLGNVGSYFFAYVLAVMHLSLPLDVATPISRLSLTGLCFLVPIADGCMVTAVRIWSLRSPFHADKGHSHHRLIQTCLPLRYLLLVFGSLELFALISAGVLAAHSGAIVSVMPPYILCSYAGITAIFILLVDKASKQRLQFYFQRLDRGEPIYFMKYVVTKLDASPINPVILRRLEARVSSEIRITDLCYGEQPNKLFVSIGAQPEPLTSIAARLESVFASEHVVGTLEVEEGEFLRVSRNSRRTQFEKRHLTRKPMSGKPSGRLEKPSDRVSATVC